MKKTWGEIKAEILRLGFENEDVFEKHKERFFEAVNRASTVIACTVCPNTETFEIKKEEFESTYLFNIKERVESFHDYLTPACTYTKDMTPAPCRILPDRRLYIEDSEDITVWYTRLPQRIDINTADRAEIDLEYAAATLLPLLSCFYIWQEDDERKAVVYRNDYEALKNELFLKRNKAYVEEGESI